MTLFASKQIDDVTVRELATTIGMTPAAVYYHFASKEQIIERGLEIFSNDLVAEVTEAALQVESSADLEVFMARLLAWAARRDDATVYFVTAVGHHVGVEVLRRETRLRLLDALAPIGRLVDSDTPGSAAVAVVGLLAHLELVLASSLADDDIYRELGPERFVAESAAVAAQITGC